ncbi:helicase-related protein [Lacticaseibacillus thailandensis]|nr:helicase-related protein [Lacticaseibacillus thailandensis]
MDTSNVWPALAGQQLTAREAQHAGVPAHILAQILSVPAVARGKYGWHCARCQGWVASNVGTLPAQWGYCPECIVLGRLTSTDQLYRFPNQPLPPQPDLRMSWSGQLTAQQTRVAGELITAFDAGERRLLWAVTGAGKTEMLFPVIEHALRQGGRVAIVSPRVDVILELAPRLQRAFTTVEQAVRYGGTGPASSVPLLLATTHQLLRYYAAFALVVVDEVDAFPFTTEPMLARAVNQAACGTVLYLTATPGPDLLRQVRRHQLAVSYLPRRFHGAPLPEPDVVLARGGGLSLPRRLLQQLRMVMTTEQSQVMIFVPAIRQLRQVQATLAKQGIVAATVYAGDPARAEKVKAFRDGHPRVLVTTTILERGVTIYNCAVMVLQADAPLFGVSALVQMAGRAGRDREHADNPVWFVCAHYTLSIRRACRQIRQLNARGES